MTLIAYSGNYGRKGEIMSLINKIVLNESERQLFGVDTFRQGTDGVFNTLKETVFLLVAIQYFAMPDSLNSLISISGALGMLAGLYLIPALERRFAPGRILAGLSLVMGLSLIVPVFIPGRAVYAVAVSVGIMMTSLRIPFFSGFYDECYRVDRMAQLMSIGSLISILVATGVSWLFGTLLDMRLEFYKPILMVSGVLFVVTAWILLGLPPSRHRAPERSEPFWKNISLIWKEPRFGFASLSWMLVGFANLWSVPIRTVYLSDPERGLGLKPMTVLIILGIIPGILRLLSNFLWARFYDKYRFVVVRMTINVLLGLGIFLYFLTSNLAVISLGAALIYLALTGGPITWTLWVTRIAPPGETRKYMSVHAFLAGLRGLAGPPLAFAFIQSHNIQTVGKISVVLALLSVLALLPLFREEYRF